jgi:hypothetical protein
VCVLFWVVCEKFEVDIYYDFRTFFIIFIFTFWLTITMVGQKVSYICKVVSDTKTIPYKIVRDVHNNCYEINHRLDKIKISNVKLKENSMSDVQIIKYKQKFWLLDWMLFDFEEKTLYVNVNEKIEIIY